MTSQQITIFAILLVAMGLFVWGRWRFDVVAVAGLMAGVILGVVPVAEAFLGFGHPAVITVAAVLIISRAIRNSGIVGLLARPLAAVADRPIVQIGGMTGMAALLSAFMNNVGALALLMPVAIKTARVPAQVLMPLSFGSILGGLTTLIGTPPNIIIATYRGETLGASFRLFDFAPVGAAVALAGLLFITFVGWRLIPKERRGKRAAEDLFEIKDYVTEVRVGKDSKLVGERLSVLAKLSDREVVAIGLIRGERRYLGPLHMERLAAGDIVIVEGDPAALHEIAAARGLDPVGDDEGFTTEHLRSDEVGLIEAVVPLGSPIAGRTAEGLHLRRRHGVNLLAVARQGKPFKQRLHRVRLRAGDVLLLQGESDGLAETVTTLGCLPLAERALKLGRRRTLLGPIVTFAAALAATGAGLVPVHIAFGAAVVALVALELLPAREVYEAIDWPVIVLLGAMIPLGGALESSGGTASIAAALAGLAGHASPLLVLTLLLVVTMTLSDVMNNAATAVVMAPIAVSLAQRFGVGADAFLMAVAVGASCAFLTPIGHQNNILVMGPGGYRFGDYWRMGLPLEALIVLVAVPMIALIWPF